MRFQVHTMSLHVLMIAAITVQAALLVHLDFEEGTGSLARDKSGNNRHGSLRNGARWTSGYLERGTGVSFAANGADGNVTSGARVSVPIRLPLPAGSICLWYYVKPYYDFQTVLDNEVNDSDWEMWVQQTTRHPGTPRWYKGLRFRTGGNAEARDIGRVTCDLDTLGKEGYSGPNHWYFVVATWARKPTVENGITYTYATHLYVNGKLRDYAGTNDRSVIPGDSVHLAGKRNATKGNGIIDEFRVYDTALEPAEVDALYRQYMASTALERASVHSNGTHQRGIFQQDPPIGRHVFPASLTARLLDGRTSGLVYKRRSLRITVQQTNKRPAPRRPSGTVVH